MYVIQLRTIIGGEYKAFLIFSTGLVKYIVIYKSTSGHIGATQKSIICVFRPMYNETLQLMYI